MPPKYDDFSAIDAAEQLDNRQLKVADKEEATLVGGREALQKEVHVIAMWALRIGALMLALLIGVRLFHMAAPHCWRWLNPDDLQSMDKILFSSALGGVVLGYLKEIMRPIEK